MGCMKKLTPFLLLLLLNGCATLPKGPSVKVLPAQGKSFDTFRAEDATCRQWAEQQGGMSTQQTYEKNVATGAIVGTAIGTGLGAAVGSASGHAGAGAIIGGASGLLVGTAAGSDSGRVYGREAQLRYDNAYVQCMYSYGNQVPGSRPRVVAAPPRPVAVAPPPPPPDVMAQADVPPPPPPEEPPAPGQYPLPPEVYVDMAPQFIYSPALNLYVAVGVPYDLVYTGVDYFYFYGGRWYRGPYYNGPWALATRRHYPPVLLRYRIDHIRHYRDAEFRRYERDRVRYDGRFHRPDFRSERRG
jgi:outer membrane lipoprotein SlyB